MVESGVNPELLLGGKYDHQLHFWDMKSRGIVSRAAHPNRPGEPLNGGPQMVDVRSGRAARLPQQFALRITLIAFGAYKFLKPRSHPRWVKLQVTARELAVWSFLMSTAHGAGLMLFPILVGLPEGAHALARG